MQNSVDAIAGIWFLTNVIMIGKVLKEGSEKNIDCLTNSQLIATQGEILIVDQREAEGIREKMIIGARGATEVVKLILLGSNHGSGNGMIADGKMMVSVAR